MPGSYTPHFPVKKNADKYDRVRCQSVAPAATIFVL